MDYREEAKNTALTFKTNWLQLGELLTKVATEKLYQQWGFPTFEEYCKKELRIKKNTAIKLTNAYFFITESEPKLADKGLDLDVVSVLQKAKSDDKCSPEIFEELKEQAVDKKKSASTVSRRLKMMTEDSQSKANDFHRQNLKLVRQLLQRIKPNQEIPDKYKTDLSTMAEFFESATQTAGV